MDEEISVLIKGFKLGGYRSFGKTAQYFEKFSKINLFIGKNNCGKSNVLRFLHNHYPSISKLRVMNMDPLDTHIPSSPSFVVGRHVSLEKDKDGNYSDFLQEIGPLFSEKDQASGPHEVLLVFLEKEKLDGRSNAWFTFDRGLKLLPDNWEEAFRVLDDRRLRSLWNKLTHQTQGSRKQHWFPETLKSITPKFSQQDVILISAIRSVGSNKDLPEDFNGAGLIERLAKLQNPDVLDSFDKDKFDAINEFLQSVTDNRTAVIEIPHTRETILVNMDEKRLPLDSLGTGIEEVIIIAAAATILDNTVVCVEEPELHLNPLLQKKLVRYLSDHTTNQYFISTHSAALMDTPNSEIYHIQLLDGQSVVERVTSDKHRSSVCEDLGFHPSDLLQANCVIWVEGPSDRIYLNYWIKALTPDFIEGIQYSIMFYGGRLVSHLSGDDITELVDDFISLRRLNRRGVIIIDSDKDKSGKRINSTKKRLKEEFDKGPGFAWVTEGREIENYLPIEHVKKAIAYIKPSATTIGNYGKYDNLLNVKNKSEEIVQVPKVGVARYIIENEIPDLSNLGLRVEICKVIKFIEESNPGISADDG